MLAFAPGPWGACGRLCFSFTGTQFPALEMVDLADTSRTDVGEGDGLPVRMDMPGTRVRLSGSVLPSGAPQKLWTMSAPRSQAEQSLTRADVQHEQDTDLRSCETLRFRSRLLPQPDPADPDCQRTPRVPTFWDPRLTCT